MQRLAIWQQHRYDDGYPPRTAAGRGNKRIDYGRFLDVSKVRLRCRMIEIHLSSRVSAWPVALSPSSLHSIGGNPPGNAQVTV